jgi:hypothetical protein
MNQSTNQSINQPINESMNKWINQSMNQSINQSISNQSITCRPVRRWALATGCPTNPDWAWKSSKHFFVKITIIGKISHWKRNTFLDTKVDAILFAIQGYFSNHYIHMYFNSAHMLGKIWVKSSFRNSLYVFYVITFNTYLPKSILFPKFSF